MTKTLNPSEIKRLQPEWNTGFNIQFELFTDLSAKEAHPGAGIELGDDLPRDVS